MASSHRCTQGKVPLPLAARMTVQLTEAWSRVIGALRPPPERQRLDCSRSQGAAALGAEGLERA